MLLLALAAPAAAQQGSTTQPGNPPQAGTKAQQPAAEGPDLHILDPATPKGRRFYDGVIAMVGDRAILHSTIRAEVGAGIAGLLGARGSVNLSRTVELAKKALQQHLHTEVQAQSARLTDSLTPSELKEMLNAELQRYLNDMIADFGSYNSYLDALEATQTTWEEVAQRHTDLVLQQRSAAQLYANVMSRSGSRTNLWVTPREMRRYYDEHRSEWRQSRSAEVERVLFQDQDPAKAQAKAAAAAEAWRANQALDPEALAASHDGTARAAWHVDEKAELAPFVKAFAAEGKPMQVSEPTGGNGAYWVMRLRKVQEAIDMPFSDPRVQKAITRKLADAELFRMQERMFERNSTSLFWFVQPDLWRF